MPDRLEIVPRSKAVMMRGPGYVLECRGILNNQNQSIMKKVLAHYFFEPGEVKTPSEYYNLDEVYILEGRIYKPIVSTQHLEFKQGKVLFTPEEMAELFPSINWEALYRQNYFKEIRSSFGF